MGSESWHQQLGQTPHWLEWCQENLVAGIGIFEDRKAGEAAQRFFGSWYAIEGISQTGYYLGWEAIKMLNQAKIIEEIAFWKTTKGLCRGC